MVRIHNPHAWKRLELRHKKRMARIPCAIIATLILILWMPWISLFAAVKLAETTGGTYILAVALFGIATLIWFRIMDWSDLK